MNLKMQSAIPPAPAPMSNAPIQRLATEFAKAALSRITALIRFFGPEANPDTVAHFLEQVVAELLEQRIGPKRFASGVLHTLGQAGGSSSRLLDGIVHDPSKGAVALRTGGLSVVSADVCAGVIWIKSSVGNLAKFESRLWEISKYHFRDRPISCVMGVVVRDPDARAMSRVSRSGYRFEAHSDRVPKWCPIYVLFSYSGGHYTANQPAIEATLTNIHRNIQAQW